MQRHLQPAAQCVSFIDGAAQPTPSPEVFFDEDGLNIQSSFDPALEASLVEATIRYGLIQEDGSTLYLGEEPGIFTDDGSGIEPDVRGQTDHAPVAPGVDEPREAVEVAGLPVRARVLAHLAEVDVARLERGDGDLGGLRAQPTISGHAGERPPRPPAKIGSGTIMASPAPQPTATPPPLDADARKRPRNPAKSTDLGGIQGETRLVSRALERALEEKKTQPSSLSKSDKVTPPLPMPEPQAEPDVPVSSGAWMNPTSKGGAPGAMILKPARKRMRADSQQQAASRPRQKTPKRPTLPDTMPPETKRQRAGQTSHIENNATKLGWSRDDLTRRAPDPIAEPAKDDWFDYFADDAVGAPDPSARIDALDFAVSEGSEAEEATSLPPETLERLLDSGPQMVDMQEAFLVLDSRDAEKAFEAAEQVAEVGAAALGVLDLMFPGRIFIDRYQHPDELPPVNEHGPLLHALVRIGDKSVDIARRHINDSSNETRFYATFLFTRLNAEGVLSDLFARLFDRDTQVRRLAADILLDYHQTPDFDRCVRKPLRAELLSTEDIHVEVAARLIGRLRDSDAVIALIDTMEETEAPRVRQAVREALKVVTLHSWSSPYEWRHWWEKARDESRSTWLVEALDSPAYELRQLAFDEVRRIPGLDLNYHPEQPPKLRRRAQQELTSWFQTHDY